MMWPGWILLAALVAGVFLLMNNSNLFGSRHSRGDRETPLDILKRRYANGEITTEEYEERKRKLEE